MSVYLRSGIQVRLRDAYVGLGMISQVNSRGVIYRLGLPLCHPAKDLSHSHNGNFISINLHNFGNSQWSCVDFFVILLIFVKCEYN